jgi:hypothetical protein
VVPGWQAVLAPKYGVAYDVPPGWKLAKPDEVSWVQDAKDNVLAGENAVVGNRKGKCTRAQTGLRGGSNPISKPAADQMSALTGRADDEARKWAAAVYGGADAHPHPPRVDPGQKDTITVNGINAARVSVMVTTTAKEDACTPPHAVVEAVAMAAANNASTAGSPAAATPAG